MTEGLSDDEVERRVTKRLREQDEIIKRVADALRPELDRMSRRILDANHVKRTIGRQLTQLTDQVKQTNAELRAHTILPFHPEGADTMAHFTEMNSDGMKLLEEFGVASLSLEQKQALPEMLEDHVRTRETRIDLDRRQVSRRDWIHLAVTFGAAIAGSVSTAIAVLSYLHATGGHA